MDRPIIEHPNTNKEANLILHHHPVSINSHSSPTFLLHNRFGSSQISSDVEMITVRSVSYTSLKDLLPCTSSTIGTSSPTHNSSWHDDVSNIKNPLVKHAALAYLQPMSTPPEVGEKGMFGRLVESCCGECGCVSWISDVVWRNVKETFLGRREEVDSYYEHKVD